MEASFSLSEIINKIAGDRAKKNLDCDLTWNKEKNKYNKPRKFGFVYGMAIKLDDSKDYDIVKKAIEKDQRGKDITWSPIDNTDYYPLYWGKAETARGRLLQHFESNEQTGALQLNELEFLHDHDIVYGVVFCGYDYSHVENELRAKHPDILKTTKKNKREFIRQSSL